MKRLVTTSDPGREVGSWRGGNRRVTAWGSVVSGGFGGRSDRPVGPTDETPIWQLTPTCLIWQVIDDTQVSIEPPPFERIGNVLQWIPLIHYGTTYHNETGRLQQGLEVHPSEHGAVLLVRAPPTDGHSNHCERPDLISHSNHFIRKKEPQQ